MLSNMRSLIAPFIAAPPAGARIRTRLRVDSTDARVLRLLGDHLGGLASVDVAVRCQLGHHDDQRASRKRALTACSSSRWAGAITRTANDQWQRGYQNLLDTQVGLRRAVTAIRARLGVPVGAVQGRGRSRVRGYASQAERFEKRRRLQRLEARLGEVEARIAAGRVSVCRGGRQLAKLRHALDRDDVKLTETQWRERWQAERLFVTADGEADARWGNQTIRVHPDEGWLELRLPTPLAYLSNTPGRAATYRLSCKVAFFYRQAEWAAQASSGAVRYDLSFDPTNRRWYLAASWQQPKCTPPTLEVLRQQPSFVLDLNADHLAGWVLDPSGNPVGDPATIPVELAGLPATTRGGRLRAAVTQAVRAANAAGCHSIVIENLDFADVRHSGRERLGRGRRGKRFRRAIAGIPTRQFRDLLAGMAANAGLWVVAVDPAYTSRWGGQHWQAPLNVETNKLVIVSRHHAAAVVIGRRGGGFGARRRRGAPQPHQRMGAGELPARPGEQSRGCEGPGPPGGQRAAARPHLVVRPYKTRLAERAGSGDQVAQDRLVPPVSAHVAAERR